MRVLLFTIATKEPTSQALEAICAWLKAQGIGYRVYTDSIHAKADDPRFEQLRDSIADYDLVCSFGGDGTTLRAAHLIGASELPLLSFNFGRLGFLSGASADDLMPAIQAAVQGSLAIDARTMLKASVSYRDGSQKCQIGLNELAVSRGHFGRIVALDLYVNNTYLDTVRGDGVLISTATGSTAYSLSAGGPIIAPSHDGLCIVPIAPHSLASRAVVTTAADSVRIVPNEQNRQQLVLFIDGERFCIQPQVDTSNSLDDNTSNNLGGGDADNGGNTDNRVGASTADGTDNGDASTDGTDGGDNASTADSDSGASTADGQQVASVEISVCPSKLRLLRYGGYDFYGHISTTFFGSDYAR